MQNALRNTLLLLAGLLFSISCAKERKIERIKDFENNRWAKSFFMQGTPYLGKVTVVKTSQRSAFAFIGMQSELRAGYFEFTKDKLIFKDAVSLYQNDQTAGNVINSWDITHSQYHLGESNGKVTNREEENNDIPWSQKNYFRVDWEKANVSESASFPWQIDSKCWSPIHKRLQDSETKITPEIVNFTIAVDYQISEDCIKAERQNTQDFTHTVHYKYSFAPMKQSDYQPYLYSGESDPLFYKYGYFTSIIEGMGERGVPVNKFLMNRYNINQTHTYYFAPGTPDAYKDLFTNPDHGVIAETNKLFQANGLKTRFEVKDADSNNQFGDVGKSFIRFITELDDGAPLGYGPQDTNPFNGEIIGGSVNIWTGYLDYYVNMMQEQSDRQNTLSANSSVVRVMRDALGAAKADWTKTAVPLKQTSSGDWFRALLPQYTFGLPGGKFTNVDEKQLFKGYDFNRIQELLPQSARNQIGPLTQELDTAQTTKLQEQVRNLRNAKLQVVYDIEPALGEVRRLNFAGLSPDEIKNRILYRTAIHEFGHNLGLRHNFYGSIDHKNFRGPVEDVDFDGKRKSFEQSTSSVMDYMPLKDEMHFNFGWEKYDEAAILFAYSNGDIDLSKKNNTTFLYCTDEDTHTNALCNRHDSGTTPSEVVASMIENYEDSYWVRNFRNDRTYWHSSRYAGGIFSTMWDIKKFLAFYDNTYQTADATTKLSKIPGLTPADRSKIVTDIQSDMVQALKLSVAFYHSVMQQPNSDRAYGSVYDPRSGSLTQMGISADKIFAMRFLMGDESFAYNPNRNVASISYFDLMDNTELKPLITNVVSTNLTTPGAMSFGYDTLTREYYLLSAYNMQSVGGDRTLVDKMKVSCYQPATLKSRLNITDASKIGSTFISVAYSGASDPYFGSAGEIAGILVGGNYYIAQKDKNTFAHQMISQASGGDESSIARTQVAASDLYAMFHKVTLGSVPTCQ